MKYKSEHTEIDYLNSIPKKYKSEYRKNNVQRSRIVFEKHYKVLKDKNKI